MNEILTSAAQGENRIGPGRLVLIVGPSGAGKDTLIALARAQCTMDDDVSFVRRTVTRAASAAEDNEQIDVAAFHAAALRGEFALHWEAHGHCYGLPRTIDDDIRQGRTIVANVSRTMIAPARRAYADAVVVEITAPADVLALRLAQRARSSDGTLDNRLTRAIDNPIVADVTIENVGDAEEHTAVLLRTIRKWRPSQ